MSNKPMTNYNERLDEILLKLARDTTLADRAGDIATTASAVNDASKRYQWSLGDTKQAITSLIKELVAEAKPAEKEQQLPSKIDNETMCRYYRYGGYNFAIDEFEQNLLKALEEV